MRKDAFARRARRALHNAAFCRFGGERQAGQPVSDQIDHSMCIGSSGMGSP